MIFNILLIIFYKIFKNFTNELHIYCPDRLSRGKREANDLIDEMRLYNIPICFDLGTQCASSMNDGDMIYINKDLQEAEELSDKTSERVRMSLKRKRQNPLPGMNYLSLETKKDSTLDDSDDSDDSLKIQMMNMKILIIVMKLKNLEL